jgi:hypothetical protein
MAPVSTAGAPDTAAVDLSGGAADATPTPGAGLGWFLSGIEARQRRPEDPGEPGHQDGPGHQDEHADPEGPR